MTERFYCDNCQEVGIAGDHECAPKGCEEFLGWLRQDYVQCGPATWIEIIQAWGESAGDYLRYLVDITGEVVCDTGLYPPRYRPAGSEADLRTAVGLQQHLEAAVKLATERKWGKVAL